jgi:hypothetical protein
MGGRRGEVPLSEVLVYFSARDTGGEDPWEAYVDLPAPRYSFGAASIYDKIYLIGGMSGNGSQLETSGLLLDGEAWEDLPTETDFTERESVIVSLGSLLAIFDSSDSRTTHFWTYQAFYYSIYIPFVP